MTKRDACKWLVAFTTVEPDGTKIRHFCRWISRYTNKHVRAFYERGTDVKQYAYGDHTGTSDLKEVTFHHIWVPRGYRVMWHMHAGNWNPPEDREVEQRVVKYDLLPHPVGKRLKDRQEENANE